MSRPLAGDKQHGWLTVDSFFCDRPVCLSDAVIKEFKRILADSEITKCVVSCSTVHWRSGVRFLWRSTDRTAGVSSSTRPNRQDDDKWPKKNVVGKQELEVKLAPYHISFQVRATPSAAD